jgi:vacuolar-type H+-ATPase subunit F/Vma7
MRLIAVGEAELTAGFGLLGFEMIETTAAADLEHLCAELLAHKSEALVFFSATLKADGRCCQHVRLESAHILLIEIPPLNAPASHRPAVEDLVARVLGAHVLASS